MNAGATAKQVNASQKNFGRISATGKDMKIGSKAQYHFIGFRLPWISHRSFFLRSSKGRVRAPRITTIALKTSTPRKINMDAYSGRMKPRSGAGASTITM